KTKDFGLFIDRLLDNPSSPLHRDSITTKEKTRNSYLITGENLTLEHILQIIKDSKNEQTRIIKLLTLYIDKTKVRSLLDINSVSSAAIINYLLKDGKHLQESLVAQYTRKLSHAVRYASETNIIRRLHEIFLRILLDYDLHKGRQDAFIRLFRTAVLFNFPGIDLATCNENLYDHASEQPEVKEKNP